MKFCTILLFVILCQTLLVESAIPIEIENNVTFIEDIKNWLKITHVIILYDDSDEDSEESIFVFQICRRLIMKQIQTLSLKFTNLQELNEVYEKSVNQPLIAVYLSKVDSFKKFESFSENVNMKWATWLIIFRNKSMTSIFNYCPNPPRNIFHLSFNSKVIVKCYDDQKLYKWFSINENQIEVHNLANWNQENHIFNKTNDIFFGKNHNIGGQKLRSVILENKSNSKSNASELYMIVLMELGRVMNFTHYTVSEESQYGTLENGVWTGIMNKTASGEADVAAVGMSMTAKRMRRVDFTQPIIESYKALYFRQPNGTQVRRFGYFQAFNKYVWGVFILLLITIPLCLTYIKMGEENCRSLPLLFEENFLDVWRIYCQQGIAGFPKRGSLRIIYFVTFMLSLVLLSAYSASLISRLAVASPKLPFSSLKQFIYQSKYKMIVIQKGETFDSIKNFQNNYTTRMNKLLKNDKELPLSFTEGFNMICKDKYLVFLVEQSAETSIENFNSCPMKKIPTITKISLAMALQKNSPYTAMFNYHLQKFKEYGILNRLVRQTMKRKVDTEFRNVEPVTLGGVDTVFEIVICAFVLSIVILILENIHYYYHEKRERGKRNQMIALFIRRDNVKNKNNSCFKKNNYSDSDCN